jgi:hypothetical protein
MVLLGHSTVVSVSYRTNLFEKSLGGVRCGRHIVDETEAEFSLPPSELASFKTREHLNTHNLGQQSSHAIGLLDRLVLNCGRVGAYRRVPVRRSARL